MGGAGREGGGACFDLMITCVGRGRNHFARDVSVGDHRVTLIRHTDTFSECVLETTSVPRVKFMDETIYRTF